MKELLADLFAELENAISPLGFVIEAFNPFKDVNSLAIVICRQNIVHPETFAAMFSKLEDAVTPLGFDIEYCNKELRRSWHENDNEPKERIVAILSAVIADVKLNIRMKDLDKK
jgi:hypothetical protein